MSSVSSALQGANSAESCAAGKLDPLAQLLAGDAGPVDFAALLAQAFAADAKDGAPPLVPEPDGDNAVGPLAALEALAAALQPQTPDGTPIVAPTATTVVPAPAADTDAPAPSDSLLAPAGKGRAQEFLAALQAQRGVPAEKAPPDAPSGADGNPGTASLAMAKIAAPAGKADALPAPAADTPAPPGPAGTAPSAGVAAMHAPLPGAHAAPHTGGAAPTPITVSVHDPRWAGEMGQKMVWMARQDVQSAQLSISPAHLGPIDITLNIGSDGATALFHSANAEVRDLLEAALPRLREMMGQAGIQLSDARVGAQNQGQPDAQSHSERRFGANERGGNAILLPESAVNHDMRAGGRAPAGLVDLFA